MLKLTSVLLIGGLMSTTCLAEKWHMPTPYGDGNLPTQIDYEFAKEIKAKTDGKLDIIVHSGGSLVKHTEIPRSVQTGQVQIGEIFMGILGNQNPVFKHDNIPFLATTFRQAKLLWKAAKPEVVKALDKQGMKLLYAVPWPAQNLYTKNPVSSLADIKGEKMRAYSPSTSRLADLMGTVPTTIQVPDIPQAFSTGIIQAMVTSPSTGVDSQAWDYVHNYTEINAWIPKDIVIVNKRAFRRLDKATQKIVLEAAKRAEEEGWKRVVARAQKDTATLAKHGMNIAKPTPELESQLKAIGQTMTKEWEASDPQEIDPILARYKKELAQ